MVALVAGGCSSGDDAASSTERTESSLSSSSTETTASLETTPITETTPSTEAATSSAVPNESSAAVTSSACARGGGGTITTLSVNVNGTARTALVDMPANGTGPYPVVISFHGANEQADGQQLKDGFGALGKDKGFVTVYPQGVTVDIDDIVRNVVGWDVQGRAVNEPAFVAALLDELGTKVCIDTSRVFATGASNGAAMAYALGCALPDRIAGVATVEGAFVPIECSDTASFAMLAFHGREDAVVPIAGSGPPRQTFTAVADLMASRAAANGCAAAPTVTDTAATVHRSAWSGCTRPVVLYVLDKHGHAWPGRPLPVSATDLASWLDPAATASMGLTPESMAANLLLTNMDIDATTTIWAFFDSLAPAPLT